MGIIYRKSLKGIDELAFKTTGLPMRLMSYLSVVNGESTVEQLAAQHRQLPSLDVVLQGLCEQGFLEVASSAANVVQMNTARVGNGAPEYSTPVSPSNVPPMMQQAIQSPMQQQLPRQATGFTPELDLIKTNMVRDISSILGSDAAQVIQKIQGCHTKDDLFATMMGIKKIITIYANAAQAEKFAIKYQSLV
jgi:hypothetical protein